MKTLHFSWDLSIATFDDWRNNFDKIPSTGRVGSSLAPRTWAEISPPEAERVSKCRNVGW